MVMMIISEQTKQECEETANKVILFDHI